MFIISNLKIISAIHKYFEKLQINSKKEKLQKLLAMRYCVQACERISVNRKRDFCDRTKIMVRRVPRELTGGVWIKVETKKEQDDV